MHNIICPEQIGFSKGSRSSDHMFVLKTLIDKYTQQGSKHLYTCFVDFCSFWYSMAYMPTL